MSTTLHDIAAAVGVSVATVSNALRDKGRVSKTMRDKIREEADRMGYSPSLKGRALRTGRSGVIGLVLPDIANPLFPAIAQAIQAAALDLGLGVLIADSRGANDTQTEALTRLIRHGADGLIVVPRRGTEVPKTSVPVAVIDAPSNPGNTICADHRAGGGLVLRHLRAQGHRHIQITGHSPGSRVQNDRIAGMRDACPADTRLSVHWLQDGPLPSTADLLAKGITALAATSDLIALPFLTQLQAEGYRVPDQFAVTGFDDHAFSSLVAPGLTTVAQDTDQIARVAIAHLLAKLDGTDVAHAQTVPVRLIIRGSTQSAPALNKNPIPAPNTQFNTERHS